MTASFDLVIFDCDGVLVDTERLGNHIFVTMLAELGLMLDEAAALAEFVGAAGSLRIKTVETRFGWTLPTDFRAAYDARFEASLDRVAVIPGVAAALDRLTLPRAVASNGSGQETRAKLAHARLSHHFGDAVFSGEDMGRPKPLPDVYLAAARHFDIDPARCAVVEDTVTGTTAAKRAGMTVFGYAGITQADCLSAAGARPFTDMADLSGLLHG